MNKILSLTLMLSLLFLSRAEIDLKQWELFAEDTTELSISSQMMGKVSATNEDTVGFPIQFFDSTTQTWAPNENNLRGAKLKLSSDSYEFYSNKNRRLFSRSSSQGIWSMSSNCYPLEFEVTPNHIWFVGSPNTHVNSGVYRQDRTTGLNTNMEIQAKKIAVSPNDDEVWIIIEGGDILRYDEQGEWAPMPGKANQIMIASSSLIIIVSQEVTSGGFALKKWDSATQSWETIQGIAGTFVTHDADNNLYVVTTDHKVYRQKQIASSFCPMCRENCPECANYEGYCTEALDKCIVCPAGTFVAESPLRCEPCSTECKECSSYATCTACPTDQYLTPNSTCLASCDAPLVEGTDSAGNLLCKGPCADEAVDIYYYPTSARCQQECDLPINLPGSIYQSCDPCPENCRTCSSTTECLECEAGYFVFTTGVCIDSCELPLISSDVSGVSHCKGPCEDYAPNNFYYPSNQTCQVNCDLSISNPGDLFESCDPCPDNCKTCSNSEVCSECIADHFLFEDGTCMDSCEPPLISFTTETEIQSCKKPCVEGQFYYPSNQTCQTTCDLSISNPEDMVESCDPCPENCKTCSSTTDCLECKTDYFVFSTGACVNSCEFPLISSGVSGVPHCKGPCEDYAPNNFYYPSNQTCQVNCDLSISNPGDLFESCDPCSANCKTCSSTTECLECEADYFVFSTGACIDSCELPLISSDISGVSHCKGPCEDEAPNNFYYPSNQTCQVNCDLSISSPGNLFESCNPCPDNCKTCSSTTTCVECIADHFLVINGTCIDSCEPPRVNFTTESGAPACKGPCDDQSSDIYYYPINFTCQSTCQLSIPNPNEIFASCSPCPDDCLECSSPIFCTQCSPNFYMSPSGVCLSSCDQPKKNYSDDDGNLHCKGPCADEEIRIFYYPSNGECQPTCGAPIISPGEIYTSCTSCPQNCEECFSEESCLKCTADYFLLEDGTCVDSCAPPLVSFETQSGGNGCRGPCDNEEINTFYYPSNQTCQETCGVSISNPEDIFDSCEPCPSNCLTCSSTETCLECIADHFLLENATCIDSCLSPRVQFQTESGVNGCKGPCHDETVKVYYYESNKTCQATCGVAILNFEDLYESCDPCPNDCLTCSNTESCDQCISTSFLHPLGMCLHSCPHPLVAWQEAPGNLHCKAPCADQGPNDFYYPSNQTCQATCDLPIETPEGLYQSCDPCPENCGTCSSTMNCLVCKAGHFLLENGTCIDSCETPRIQYLTETGVQGCKGPCADEPIDIYYYPSNNECLASCIVPIGDPNDFYERCAHCPIGCETCSSTTTCEQCDSNHFLSPSGICLDACDAPAESYHDEAGILRCRGPCANETINVFYHSRDQTCKATCGILLSGPEELYASCDACPENCLHCSSTTTCEQCVPNSFLSADKTCFTSCEPPLVSYSENGVRKCRTPCAGQASNIYYYPTDDSCRPTCDLPIANSDPLYESCNSCPTGCFSCSSPTQCSQCNSTSFFSPLGTCLSSCEAPLRNFTDENGNAHCTGPCEDELFYYPADGTCQPICEVEIHSQASFFKSCKRHELRTITQSVTQKATQVINAFVVGSVRGVSSGISSKIWGTLQYLNVTYSEELETTLPAWKTSFLPYPFSFPIPQQIKDQEEGRKLFSETPLLEEQTTSTSFLLNYWDQLCYLACIAAAFLVSWVLAFIISLCAAKKSFIRQLLTGLRVMIQNYLFCYIYMTFGDVVFYCFIEFRKEEVSTALQRPGFIVAVALLFLMFIVVLLHFWVIQEYRSAKKMNAKTEGRALKKFTENYQGFKLFFLEFNDDSIFQQAFLIFLVARDIISSVILLTLIENPFIQLVILLSLNVLMISYLLWKRPFKVGLGMLHQFFNEIVFFAVYSSLLLINILDRENSSAETTRNKVGEIIIHLNFAFNIVSAFFMAAQILKMLFKDFRLDSISQKQNRRFNVMVEESESVIDQSGQSSDSSDDEEDLRRKARKSSARANNKAIKKQSSSRKVNRHRENLRAVDTEGFELFNEEEIRSPKNGGRVIRRKTTRNNSESRILGQIISRLVSSREPYNNY